jgi:fermentation-respiration switch protein FrsA (DUF1100 family)
MYLDRFAEVFAQAGLGALVYDNRNFGASDGEPRLEIDPWAQVHDYRHAITIARGLSEVDRDRIGIWGSSYSGGHVLAVGAIDRRVRCVVSQVPLISGWHLARRLIRADMIAPTQEMFDADREARYRGEPPAMIAVVSDDPNVPCGLPTADSFQWFTETARTRAPSWRNETTLRTVEMFTEYEPGAYIDKIAPTPLLMVVAAKDHLTVVDQALGAYNQALEPKAIEVLPGGHFEAYTDPGFGPASTAARDWFVRHLLAGAPMAAVASG